MVRVLIKSFVIFGSLYCRLQNIQIKELTPITRVIADVLGCLKYMNQVLKHLDICSDHIKTTDQ